MSHKTIADGGSAPRLFKGIAVLAMGILGAMSLTGCASASNQLTLSSQQNTKSFTQTFSKAYASANSNGDYDIVMVHDANADAVTDNGSGPVSAAIAPPRQVVHIRVFWTPMTGTSADHPASTNAMVRWYLFGDRPDEASNVLEYAGSGLVKVSRDGDQANINIRGAFLSPVARRGEMADPMGNSSLSGDVVAKVDPAMVSSVLDEVSAAQEPDLRGQASASAR